MQIITIKKPTKNDSDKINNQIHFKNQSQNVIT